MTVSTTANSDNGSLVLSRRFSRPRKPHGASLFGFSSPSELQETCGSQRRDRRDACSRRKRNPQASPGDVKWDLHGTEDELYSGGLVAALGGEFL